MKICKKCGENKELSEFYKHCGMTDGHLNYCKVCVRARTKKYAQNNKEKCVLWSKEWRKWNSDKVQKSRDKWSSKNPDYKWNNRPINYKTYASQLTIDDNPILNEDGKTLQVSCRYCGKTFIPEYESLRSRVKALKGIIKGESNFYCTDGCKRSCPIYYKSVWPEGMAKGASREVQPQLRKLVLERDNWTCQQCDSSDELHCHHYEGIEINPIESADVDNCITLCKKCHRKAHKRVDCNMRRKKCSEIRQ